jgi:hypothetical protein
MVTYWILLASHILSGTSGTLMYTVFESWYVSEHSSRGYPAEWRSQTFATGTFLNGLVAIIAGVVANPLVDHLGVWSPYVLAMLLLFSAATLMGATWNENYGDRQGNVSLPLTIFAGSKDKLTLPLYYDILSSLSIV